jgi:hypothetical protein
LLDFPVKGRKRTFKVCLRFQRCHINFSGCHWYCGNCFNGDIATAETISVVSMTLLKLFQRCQWHCGNRFSEVNDTADIVLAVSLTPLKLVNKNYVADVPMKFFTLSSSDFSGVNDTAAIVSEVSITLWKLFRQCQWHRWNRFSGVNDTAEIRI